jgi:hypothetical protein
MPCYYFLNIVNRDSVDFHKIYDITLASNPSVPYFGPYRPGHGQSASKDPLDCAKKYAQNINSASNFLGEKSNLT